MSRLSQRKGSGEPPSNTGTDGISASYGSGVDQNRPIIQQSASTEIPQHPLPSTSSLAPPYYPPPPPYLHPHPPPLPHHPHHPHPSPYHHPLSNFHIPTPPPPSLGIPAVKRSSSSSLLNDTVHRGQPDSTRSNPNASSNSETCEKNDNDPKASDASNAPNAPNAPIATTHNRHRSSSSPSSGQNRETNRSSLPTLENSNSTDATIALNDKNHGPLSAPPFTTGPSAGHPPPPHVVPHHPPPHGHPPYYPYPPYYPPPPYGYHHPMYYQPPPPSHLPPPHPPSHPPSHHPPPPSIVGGAAVHPPQYHAYGNIPSVSADLSTDEKQPPLSENMEQDDLKDVTKGTFDEEERDEDIANIMNRSSSSKNHSLNESSSGSVRSIRKTMSSSSILSKTSRDKRALIQQIEEKPDGDRTTEEIQMMRSFEHRRQRKNERSRERTKENRAEMNRILKIPEHQRTMDERRWLDTFMRAKRRKNLKDRERRKRIKMMKKGIGCISESMSEGAEGSGETVSYSDAIENSASDVSQWQSLSHGISQSNTYTSQESNGEPIAYVDSIETESFEANRFGHQTTGGEHNTSKPSTMQVCSEDNFDPLCPKMFLHFASVIESPQISQNGTDSNIIQYSNQSQNIGSNGKSPSSKQISQNQLHIPDHFNDGHNGIDKQSSTVRIPLHESSRSSIFRLKPGNTKQLRK